MLHYIIIGKNITRIPLIAVVRLGQPLYNKSIWTLLIDLNITTLSLHTNLDMCDRFARNLYYFIYYCLFFKRYFSWSTNILIWKNHWTIIKIYLKLEFILFQDYLWQDEIWKNNVIIYFFLICLQKKGSIKITICN